MFNFISIRILFVILMATALFLDWIHGVPAAVYGVLLVGYVSMLVYGSYFIQSNFYVHSWCKSRTGRKAIAITFDDGPLKDFTPQVLDILQKEQVPAAFFLIGKNIEGNETLLQRMHSEGHVLGNHSFAHGFWFSLQKTSTMLADMKRCDEAIYTATGLKPALFRPPYGVTNPMVAKAIKQGRYKSIGWSVRTYDTVSKSREQLLQKSLNNLQRGDIVLLHDWGPHTIGMLSEFISEVRKKGFDIERVDKLLEIKAYY